MHRQLVDAAVNLRQQLPYLPWAFRLVSRSAGGWTIAWLALLLVQGLLPVAAVHLTRTLVDSIAAIIGVGGGWVAMLPLLPAAFAGEIKQKSLHHYAAVGGVR